MDTRIKNLREDNDLTQKEICYQFIFSLIFLFILIILAIFNMLVKFIFSWFKKSSYIATPNSYFILNTLFQYLLRN